jgi:hypothetical protein
LTPFPHVFHLCCCYSSGVPCFNPFQSNFSANLRR